MPRPDEEWNRLLDVFYPDETLIGERSEHLYCLREHDPLDKMLLTLHTTSGRVRPPLHFLLDIVEAARVLFFCVLLRSVNMTTLLFILTQTWRLKARNPTR